MPMFTHPFRLFTLGHSTRDQEELISSLKAQQISLLVDVRTIPRSRMNPQFNSEPFAAALHAAAVGYLHEPSLGSLRRPRPNSPNTAWRHSGFRGYADHMQTTEFREALAHWVSATHNGSRIAFMCAEGSPFRCHRRLLADALLALGEPVAEIPRRGRPRPWNLTPFARVTGGEVHYPAD